MTTKNCHGVRPPTPPSCKSCRMLRLPTIRAQFAATAESAEREHLSYLGFLAELLMAECEDRDRRRSERRIKAAGFPRSKWLRPPGRGGLQGHHREAGLHPRVDGVAHDTAREHVLTARK